MPHLHDVTAAPDPFGRPPAVDRPARHGQPWTDEDYDHLVELVHEGHDTPQIADALGRRESALTQRLRALLPPEQRECLADRVLPALRAAVRERPDYPWAEVMLQFPPPAPVVRQVVERAGIGGLEDDLLIGVAWAMLHCESTPDDDLRAVCDEVAARGLQPVVTDRLTTALMRRVPPVTPDEASHAALIRFDLARGVRPPPAHGPWDRYW